MDIYLVFTNAACTTAIILPIFDEPGILVRRGDPEGFHVKGFQVRVLRAPPPASGGLNNGIFERFHLGALSQMLAKIAHGACIAELGDSFTPILTDFILGKRLDYGHVIGTSSLGRTSRKNLVHVSLHREDEFITSRIQLFANFGFKPYKVVVGKAKPSRNYYWTGKITFSAISTN